MTRRLPCQPLLCCALLSMTALSSLPARAADTQLPAWRVLEYEQKAFFVTARSRLEIAPDGDKSGHWRLTASSSVASNSEEVAIDLAADGRALYRTRLSTGSGKRYKTFSFLPEHILRVRHDPPADSSLPPCRWPVSSRREVPYPPLAQGMVVTDAYNLLTLAGRFHSSGEASAEVVVNTEFNFYRVRMNRAEGPDIQVDYQVTGEKAVTGSRGTRAVELSVSPLGKLAEKPDFSLLGLNGDATVLFDRDTGLPLQLRGNAPRIGSTKIDLKKVTWRDPRE